MKERIIKFMQGRYGIDQLYRFLVSASLVSLVLAMLLRKHAGLSNLLTLAAFGLLIWAMVRTMSRNVQKRYLENLHFLEKMGSIRQKLRMRRERFAQRKDYKFFVCPTCKTNLRVPKGKGEIYITCSKCSNRFRGKT